MRLKAWFDQRVILSRWLWFNCWDNFWTIYLSFQKLITNIGHFFGTVEDIFGGSETYNIKDDNIFQNPREELDGSMGGVRYRRSIRIIWRNTTHSTVTIFKTRSLDFVPFEEQESHILGVRIASSLDAFFQGVVLPKGSLKQEPKFYSRIRSARLKSVLKLRLPELSSSFLGLRGPLGNLCSFVCPRQKSKSHLKPYKSSC